MDNLGTEESKENLKTPKPLGEVKKLTPTPVITPLVYEPSKALSLEEKLDLLLQEQKAVAEERKKEKEQVDEMRDRLAAFERDKGNSAQDLIAAIGQLTKTGNTATADKNAVFDESDWIEDGVSFFSYRVATVMASDRRKGQESFPPNGPIMFGYSSTLTKKEGSETNIVNICTYMSHSKKEVEWIEGHTEFKTGIVARRFNPNISYNQVQRALRIAKHVNHINRLGTNTVVQRCREYGLPLLEDMDAMRVNLADHMVTEEIAAESLRSERLLQESTRETLLERANPLAN